MSGHRRTRQIAVSQLPWNLAPEPAQQPPSAQQLPPLTVQYQPAANNFSLPLQPQQQQPHCPQQLQQQLYRPQQQQQQQHWQQQQRQKTDFERQQLRQGQPGLPFPVLPAHCQAPVGLRGPGANLAMSHPATSQHRCNLTACSGVTSSSFLTPMLSSLAIQSDSWLCVG